MRSLLNFFLKYSGVLIFLLLETVALFMLYNGTSYHNIRIANMAGSVKGSLQGKISNTTAYFSLRQANIDLARENLELRNRLEMVSNNTSFDYIEIIDTVRRQQYRYISATVVNQTVNRQKNFITLNRGTLHGVTPGMAVTGAEGVVGVVVGASHNFCVVMSALNLDFRLSARFRDNGYYGSLVWDGRNREQASLKEIPHHVLINRGDTIETSGYSAIFPAGLLVGTVAGVDSKAGDFLDITVDLSTDYSRLQNVYIISNLLKGEQIGIENKNLRGSDTTND